MRIKWNYVDKLEFLFVFLFLILSVCGFVENVGFFYYGLVCVRGLGFGEGEGDYLVEIRSCRFGY